VKTSYLRIELANSKGREEFTSSIKGKVEKILKNEKEGGKRES